VPFVLQVLQNASAIIYFSLPGSTILLYVSFHAFALSTDNISSVKDYHIESIEMHDFLHKRLLSTESRYISGFLWAYSCIGKSSCVLMIHNMSISNRERGAVGVIRTSTCINHIHIVAIEMHSVLGKRVRTRAKFFNLFLWRYFKG
jgi:hypothetical protein